MPPHFFILISLFLLRIVINWNIFLSWCLKILLTCELFCKRWIWCLSVLMKIFLNCKDVYCTLTITCYCDLYYCNCLWSWFHISLIYQAVIEYWIFLRLRRVFYVQLYIHIFTWWYERNIVCNENNLKTRKHF